MLAPAVLIAAGVIGLAASLASGRNRRKRDAQPMSQPHDQHQPTNPADLPDTDDPAEPELDDHTKEIR